MSIVPGSDLIRNKEMCVTGSHASVPRRHRVGLDILAAGVIDAKALIARTFPLDGMGSAFDVTQEHVGMKVVVQPQQRWME